MEARSFSFLSQIQVSLRVLGFPARSSSSQTTWVAVAAPAKRSKMKKNLPSAESGCPVVRSEGAGPARPPPGGAGAAALGRELSPSPGIREKVSVLESLRFESARSAAFLPVSAHIRLCEGNGAPGEVEESVPPDEGTVGPQTLGSAAQVAGAAAIVAPKGSVS